MMLNKTTIIKDVFDISTIEVFEHECDVCEFLQSKFEEMPKGARLYYKNVSVASDVTPNDVKEVELLCSMRGEFVLVIYPEVEILIAIVVAIVVAVLAYVFMPTPQIPNVSARNRSASSPNNELSARGNQPRVNARIPDIFGQVRSTPDLIAVPYSTFTNNQEIEYAVYCIGRGQYEIHDVKDGTTPIGQVAGSSVEIYKPNVGLDGVPYYSVGPAIDDVYYYVQKSNSVNGQTLKAPDSHIFIGATNVSFTTTGSIIRTGGPEFSSLFNAGDSIKITNGASGIILNNVITQVISTEPKTAAKIVLVSDFSAGAGLWGTCQYLQLPDQLYYSILPDRTHAINLKGIFKILSRTLVNSTTLEIILDHPELVNPEWNYSGTAQWDTIPYHQISGLNKTSDGFDVTGDYVATAVTATTITVTPTAAWSAVVAGFKMSPTISGQGNLSVGPFVVTQQPLDTIICNFVAANGLYKDDGTNQFAADIDIELTITPVNAAGTPTGAPIVQTLTLHGSAVDRDQIGLTATVYVGTGPKAVKAKRVTPVDTAFKGQIVDEVKWRDLYFARQIPADDFGNVTTAKSKTVSTAGALALKERKLNMLVTRQIPTRVSGSTFTSTLQSTRSAADIISEICRDPKIGARPAREVDYDSIYNTCAEITAYFNTPEAQEFCYTFDKEGLTFEDTISGVAQSIFSIAYRRGSVIKLSFERQTDDSVLLFNHRNKMPGTERRSVKFGTNKNYDSVEYTWVNPEDDSIETLMIPNDEAGVKPQKVESMGVRNYNQAYFQAWRIYNKLLHQNMQIEFDSIAQGELVLNNDRILVSDNTRNDEQDGDITGQTGLVVSTSQPVKFDPLETYTVFLQLADGTVQAMPALESPGDTNKFILTETPLLPLVFYDEAFSKTGYILIRDTDQNRRAFLVTDREPGDSNTQHLTGINYDSRYYANDFVLSSYGLITETDIEIYTEDNQLLTTEF